MMLSRMDVPSSSNKKHKWLRRAGITVAILLLLGVMVFGALLWRYGGEHATPAFRPVGAPPAEKAAVNVTLTSASGSQIPGWFSRGGTRQGAVLVLHGAGANRSDMVPRALFLRALGYTVFLIDMQAHGESTGGKWITFGDLESRDAAAAVEYLRHEAPGERIGIIGLSMGAAATVLAEKPLRVDAIVLESMYPTIEQAVEDRLRMAPGPWSVPLAPALITVTGWRIGVQPKQFWIVEGAAHVDIHHFAPQEYAARVGAFLAEHLRHDTR
jgi:pimeloyl-ACP methyl ester carboxylesterase